MATAALHRLSAHPHPGGGRGLPDRDNGLTFNVEATGSKTTPEPTEGIQTRTEFERFSRAFYPVDPLAGGQRRRRVIFDATESQQACCARGRRLDLRRGQAAHPPRRRPTADGSSIRRPFSARAHRLVRHRRARRARRGGREPSCRSRARARTPTSRSSRWRALLGPGHRTISPIRSTAAAQTSFGQVMTTSEQFGIASFQELSTFDAGTLGGDSGWVVRGRPAVALDIGRRRHAAHHHPLRLRGHRPPHLEQPTVFERGKPQRRLARRGRLAGGDPRSGILRRRSRSSTAAPFATTTSRTTTGSPSSDRSSSDRPPRTAGVPRVRRTRNHRGPHRRLLQVRCAARQHRARRAVPALAGAGFPWGAAWRMAASTSRRRPRMPWRSASPRRTPSSTGRASRSGRARASISSQPSASSAMLNRVTGSTPSSIAGQLNANGQVYLVNPNGIAITPTGMVRTGAFVASTLGNDRCGLHRRPPQLRGQGPVGTVANHGAIEVGRGGYAALIGGRWTIREPSPPRSAGSASGRANGRPSTSRATASCRWRCRPRRRRRRPADPPQRPALRRRWPGRGQGRHRPADGPPGRQPLRRRRGAQRRRPLGRHRARRRRGGTVRVSGRLDASAPRPAAVDHAADRRGRRSPSPAASHRGQIVRRHPRRQRPEPAAGPSASAATGRAGARSSARRRPPSTPPRASAPTRSAGDGGSVVVWSDELTSFAGGISARGGPSAATAARPRSPARRRSPSPATDLWRRRAAFSARCSSIRSTSSSSPARADVGPPTTNNSVLCAGHPDFGARKRECDRADAGQHRFQADRPATSSSARRSTGVLQRS